ncbi:MAG: cytochrome b N-terminal domain-containing protein [Bacteroidota bacterium]|nr:cytochrome b N-terminal domain-containing protein [Bacteroidota bacterium]
MKKFFKKIWAWIDDRTGITELITPLLKHPAPPRALWSYVFGSATLFVFMLQVITGVALSLLYQPSSNDAYKSLEFITNQAKFGNVLRGIHYYGASAMIILIGLHMMRTYITASYKFPREMNWISGVVLLIFTIFMGFTGQLLRWDSSGVWSSVVAAEQLGRVPFIGTYLARLLLGGNTIGAQSLSRFYSYHVFIAPAFIFIFIGLHLYLVFRNGISEPPKAGRLVDPKTYRAWYEKHLKEKSVPFWPNAAWRDVIFSSGIVIAIILLAIFAGAPALTSQPDPSVVHTSPTPDWYMIPFFALFALMPHKIESVAMMVGPLLTIFLLFSIPFISNKGERSPLKRPWAMFGVLCVFIFVISLLITGLKAPWSPDFNTKPLPLSAIKSTHPDSVVVAGVNLFYAKGCQYCHKINQYGGAAGPDLTAVGNRLSAQELTIRIVNGSTNMPAFGGVLSKDELNKLVIFLSTQK